MWIELHDGTRDHPKILKLARDLQIAEAHALGLMSALWTWALRMAPDGDLSSFDTEDIEIGAKWEGASGAFVQAAENRRLLDRAENGLVIHDWDNYAEHLKSRLRKRIERTKKREAGPGSVIFFVAISDSRVKIGHTENLFRRMPELEREYGCRPTPLGFIVAGKNELAAIHTRFAHLRDGRAECFLLNEEIVDFVSSRHVTRCDVNWRPVSSQTVTGQIQIPASVTGQSGQKIDAVNTEQSAENGVEGYESGEISPVTNRHKKNSPVTQTDRPTDRPDRECVTHARPREGDENGYTNSHTHTNSSDPLKPDFGDRTFGTSGKTQAAIIAQAAKRRKKIEEDKPDIPLPEDPNPEANQQWADRDTLCEAIEKLHFEKTRIALTINRTDYRIERQVKQVVDWAQKQDPKNWLAIATQSYSNYLQNNGTAKERGFPWAWFAKEPWVYLAAQVGERDEAHERVVAMRRQMESDR